MTGFINEELLEAKGSLGSTLSKYEKTFLKLKENSPQYILLVRRTKALRVAFKLIDNELIQVVQG